MTEFPSPTIPMSSRREVLLRYLDYFRERVVEKFRSLPSEAARQSRLPSDWSPLELVKHLTFVELRWLEWGFEGHDVPDPWGDRQGDRWHVSPEEVTDEVVAALIERGRRSRQIVEAHALEERGQPGPRWDQGEPATLERVLLHLVQEYARHLGHLDIVCETVSGEQGE